MGSTARGEGEASESTYRAVGHRGDERMRGAAERKGEDESGDLHFMIREPTLLSKGGAEMRNRIPHTKR